jgi:hypothetical protein
MQTMMLQFKHPGPPPTIDDVRRLFNLTAEEIDSQFGVLPTDPSEGLYTVLVDVRASERIKAALATRPHDPAEGIFANPPIEPFGPPPTQNDK